MAPLNLQHALHEILYQCIIIFEHFDINITLSYAEKLGKKLEYYWYNTKMGFLNKLSSTYRAQISLCKLSRHLVMIDTSNNTKKSDLLCENYKSSLKYRGIGAKWAPYSNLPSRAAAEPVKPISIDSPGFFLSEVV